MSQVLLKEIVVFDDLGVFMLRNHVFLLKLNALCDQSRSKEIILSHSIGRSIQLNLIFQLSHRNNLIGRSISQKGWFRALTNWHSVLI